MTECDSNRMCLLSNLMRLRSNLTGLRSCPANSANPYTSAFTITVFMTRFISCRGDRPSVLSLCVQRRPPHRLLKTHPRRQHSKQHCNRAGDRSVPLDAPGRISNGDRCAYRQVEQCASVTLLTKKTGPGVSQARSVQILVLSCLAPSRDFSNLADSTPDSAAPPGVSLV